MVEKIIGMKQSLEGKTKLHWQIVNKAKQTTNSHTTQKPKTTSTKKAEISTEGQGGLRWCPCMGRVAIYAGVGY